MESSFWFTSIVSNVFALLGGESWLEILWRHLYSESGHYVYLPRFICSKMRIIEPRGTGLSP